MALRRAVRRLISADDLAQQTCVGSVWNFGDPEGASQRRRIVSPWQLYLVSDDSFVDANFLAKVEGALEGGVTSVQLRLKNASTASYIGLGEKVLALTRRYRVPLIVDDRVDVALAVGADGLHVGEEDISWEMARRMIGPNRILGCSTYGRPELVRKALASEVRADYVSSGTVFASTTKPGNTPQGVQQFATLRQIIEEEAGIREVPLVAIGGITAENAAECIREGADGVAVVAGLLGVEGLPGQAAKDAAGAIAALIRDEWE